jgi:hypothetical protein
MTTTTTKDPIALAAELDARIAATRETLPGLDEQIAAASAAPGAVRDWTKVSGAHARRSALAGELATLEAQRRELAPALEALLWAQADADREALEADLRAVVTDLQEQAAAALRPVLARAAAERERIGAAIRDLGPRGPSLSPVWAGTLRDLAGLAGLLADHHLAGAALQILADQARAAHGEG